MESAIFINYQGSPKYDGAFQKVVDCAIREAEIYAKNNVDGIMIENMHDIPYLHSKDLGPEILSSMTRVASEVRKLVPKSIPCGVQILAGGNKEALACAKAADLQFIRCEGFVFGHVADEGIMEACAGPLLRYRRQIDADNILIFTDIKKKHSSHAVTADISLAETAQAAEFFSSDGVIITGQSTGSSADVSHLKEVKRSVSIPILIGSGITVYNVDAYASADALIVGSYFKKSGWWADDLCPEKVKEFMRKVDHIRDRV